MSITRSNRVPYNSSPPLKLCDSIHPIVPREYFFLTECKENRPQVRCDDAMTLAVELGKGQVQNPLL